MTTKKKAEKVVPFPKNIGMTMEEIATAVARVSRGMAVINESRMRRKAILLLISHASGESQRVVDKVLQSVADLESVFLR